MKSTLFLILLLAGCATKPEPVKEITLPPEIAAQCQKEGGCSLISEARMRDELEAAYLAGRAQGAAGEAKKRGAL